MNGTFEALFPLPLLKYSLLPAMLVDCTANAALKHVF